MEGLDSEIAASAARADAEQQSKQQQQPAAGTKLGVTPISAGAIDRIWMNGNRTARAIEQVYKDGHAINKVQRTAHARTAHARARAARTHAQGPPAHLGPLLG